MMPLLLLAAASADLDALDQAVARCDRTSVNPMFAGEELFGEKVRATLAEIGEPIDVVDVFRRPEQIPEHVEDLLAMNPRPKVVWFQLGVKNEDAARILEAAGILVVQNRCMLADHQRLGLGAPAHK